MAWLETDLKSGGAQLPGALRRRQAALILWLASGRTRIGMDLADEEYFWQDRRPTRRRAPPAGPVPLGRCGGGRRSHPRLRGEGPGLRRRRVRRPASPAGSREDRMSEVVAFNPGQRVSHAEHGEGVVVDSERNGYVRAFFAGGERLVAVTALQPFLSRPTASSARSRVATTVDARRGSRTRRMRCRSWRAPRR